MNMMTGIRLLLSPLGKVVGSGATPAPTGDPKLFSAMLTGKLDDAPKAANADAPVGPPTGGDLQPDDMIVAATDEEGLAPASPAPKAGRKAAAAPMPVVADVVSRSAPEVLSKDNGDEEDAGPDKMPQSAEPVAGESVCAIIVAPMPMTPSPSIAAPLATAQDQAVDAAALADPFAAARPPVPRSPEGLAWTTPPLSSDDGAPDPSASAPAPPPAVAPSVTNMVKPTLSEALTLLQLAREHLKGMGPGQASDANVVTASSSGKSPVKDGATTAIPLSVDTGTGDGTPMLVPTVMPSSPTISATPGSMPVIDLSASLGTQVVDMGVSGQWIDGLARDIAGLCANGAQGRFQINATQLGPVQVDIQQGADGASVSLTVATEAAEMALRKDSDRLQLDAGLSAVRISDVKIERMAHVAEAAQANSTGQQTNQHQSSQAAANWQGAEQGMGQSSGQGRWQGRENSASLHKAGGDPAVLNHADVRESAADDARSDAGHARYA